MSGNSQLLDRKIAFIGGGNMARALLGGLGRMGVDMANVRVGEPNARSRAHISSTIGAHCFVSNEEAVRDASLVVLAVKPQVASQVVSSIAKAIVKNAIVVSVMAGIRIASIESWLGGKGSVVRAMPNTPALIGRGITVLARGAGIDEATCLLAQHLMGACGTTLWVDDESHMDAVTAVSGSGPAYVFLLLEAMESAAVEQGLPADTARSLVLATVSGAAEMALNGAVDPAALRQQVTSPGGTTAAALEALESAGFRQAFKMAIAAATERSRQLSGGK